MTSNQKLAAVGAFVAAVAISASCLAGPAQPTDIVKEKYADIKGFIAKSKDRPTLEKYLRDLLETFVDYTELGKRTIPTQWDKLKPKEQKRFVDGFKKMIQRSYVRKFNPDTVFTVDLLPGTEKTQDGSEVVRSTIRSGKSEAGVNYAFHQAKGKWFAHDVIIDDVSMVKNYRKQFNDILTKSGFEGLMDKIDKKNRDAETKDGGKDVSDKSSAPNSL